MSKRRKDVIFVVLAVFLLTAASAIQLSMNGPTSKKLLVGPPSPPSTTAPNVLKTTYSLLYTGQAGGIFQPLCPVRGIVDSPHTYEDNLLDGSPSVADIDYLHNYGAQCIVDLPGYKSDRYTYEGAVYVDGSGWVSKWESPNGGRFSFLHMTGLYTSTVGMPRFYPPLSALRGPQSPTLDGDDNTARIVGSVSTHPTGLPMAGNFTGGSPIGFSRWPDSYLFGNGSCCEVDAHLCLLLDQRAADWFYEIVTGAHRPPKPHPLPIIAFEEYRTAHHEKPIPYRYHKALSWPFSVWLKHRHLRGIRFAGTFHGAKKTGYTLVGFRCGYEFLWPGYHKSKVKLERCRA